MVQYHLVYHRSRWTRPTTKEWRLRTSTMMIRVGGTLSKRPRVLKGWNLSTINFQETSTAPPPPPLLQLLPTLTILMMVTTRCWRSWVAHHAESLSSARRPETDRYHRRSRASGLRASSSFPLTCPHGQPLTDGGPARAAAPCMTRAPPSSLMGVFASRSAHGSASGVGAGPRIHTTRQTGQMGKRLSAPLAPPGTVRGTTRCQDRTRGGSGAATIAYEAFQTYAR